ncbi:MAG: hypothetical protein HQM14_03830 [SAR324 cluster bacterium]|nr:hypothetical protein [SAR324 cluster bacterium]
MLQFLEPLWLFALPASILPWLWPALHKPRHPHLFSAFFLLPKNTRHRRLLFSKEEFLLKVLRTLIIVLLCIILARPFWQKEGNLFKVWLIDDTFSYYLTNTDKKLAQYLENINSTTLKEPVWKLSQLLKKFQYSPTSTTNIGDSLTTTSPNILQIGNLILTQQEHKQSQQKLQVHVISDFQRSQFAFYQSVTQDIEWVFHRPAGMQTTINFSLHDLKLNHVKLFRFELRGKVMSNFSERTQLQVQVKQMEKKLAEEEIIWQGKGTQEIEILLNTNFKRHRPLEISLLSNHPENLLDNTRFYQWDHINHPWAAIITSEGTSDTYRHGLHQLKSVLNANQIFSFLSTTVSNLKQHTPDFIFLLGDHPIRWGKPLQNYSSKIFIPTRLGDWKSIAEQLITSDTNTSNIRHLPAKQWVINWKKAPFATEWKIQKINEALYYSPTWDLWLLSTGVSPAWGPLYQDIIFADQAQSWLKTIAKQEKNLYFGTFEAGNLLPQPITLSSPSVQLLPGHYQIENIQQQQTYHFSVNLPSQESQPVLMTDEEITSMQQYFNLKMKTQQKQQSLPSINQLREWLLLGLFGLIFAEILYVLAHLTKYGLKENQQLNHH